MSEIIKASSRKGNLVLTCSICNKEKVFTGMVAQVIIKRFAGALEKEHQACKIKAEQLGKSK